MAAVSINKISGAIISGIEKAQMDYAKMSGGEWVWNAAEYVLTTYIAKEIDSLEGSKFVTIEHSGLAAVGDAGAIGPGPKPLKARLRGRFDLVLWWANSKPRAVIEVKNHPSGPKGWIKDIDRIAAVLNMQRDNSSFNFGAFAYYYSALDGRQLSAEEKIARKLERMNEFVASHLSNNFRVEQVESDIHNEGEYGAWVAACIIIKRVNQ
ncbi:hypothetical protein KC222_12955 [Cedecea davisae]|uniref:Restriction endonuclease n=1 Tax=Cedecea davisae TaxID=158484 RepID=A0ABS6DJN8_9ENTR|nr:hypothetical protein [Cedecea davisae]MBU4682920.1 hypothetical protein [Cedecea davisae]MBU4687981.1 hypothetical protein [Cedecea davisae]